MEFKYDIRQIVRALTWDDLTGLLRSIEDIKFLQTKPSMIEMEDRLVEIFPTLDLKTKKELETLMLSCARFNSIGF